MVQLHPGSLDDWSVGVSAARLLGREEGRVRFPDGPLEVESGLLVQALRSLRPAKGSVSRIRGGPLVRAHGLTGTTPSQAVVGVRLPVGPLIDAWKVAEYGWSGRFATVRLQGHVGSDPLPSDWKPRW